MMEYLIKNKLGQWTLEKGSIKSTEVKCSGHGCEKNISTADAIPIRRVVRDSSGKEKELHTNKWLCNDCFKKQTLNKSTEIKAPNLLPGETRLDTNIKLVSKKKQFDTVARAAEQQAMLNESRRLKKPSPQAATWPRSYDPLYGKNPGAQFAQAGGKGYVDTKMSGKAFGGIKEHETFHVLTDKIRQKYGIKAQRKLIDHLYDSIHPDHRALVGDTLKISANEDPYLHKEEAIARTITMRSSKPHRNAFLKSFKDVLPQKELHANIRDSYRNIINKLKTLKPEDLQEVNLDQVSKKARSDI